MPTRLGPWLLLALLGLLFFAPLVAHPDQTLYSDYSDLLILHLPSKHFLVHSWQETGEIPLWYPYNFAGMPFVHDIQVSAFYPPHLPLYVLPESWLGAAMSWLVVLHVIAAGWCMYAYARSRALGDVGSMVAAIGYMFAGKWLLHLLAGGHYNMVPLAWLPLILLCLEKAIRQKGLIYSLCAGAGYALIVLGAYPYVTLYAGVFIALWTLGTALDEGGYFEYGEPRSKKRIGASLGRWVAYGAVTALMAVLLGAVQLLPSLEASRIASRSAGVGVSLQMLLDGLRSLVGLVGPPLSTEPNSWENRAGLGILWLTLAAMAPVIERGLTRFQGLVCCILLGFVLGGAAAVQWLPGFNLFRLPSRMFLVMALPVALLAGKTTQLLFAAPGLPLFRRRQMCQALLKVTGVVVVLACVFGFALKSTHKDEDLLFHPYWATLLVTIPGALWLLQRISGHEITESPRRWPEITWVSLLIIDLCALTWSWVEVRPEAEIFAPSECVRYLASHRDEHGRVLDFNPDSYSTAANHTPLWPGLPTMVEVEPIRGFNPIDILRYKEFLQFITDEDKPLRALDQMFTGPILGTFGIKNQTLADLLGIRYLLQPGDLELEATVQDPSGRSAWTKVFEDREPTAFNFVSVQPAGRDCGLQKLPPYFVYENRRVLPRAMVVPEASPLPERKDVLAALKTTDFRRKVLLEEMEDPGTASSSTAATSVPAARISEYRANRVKIDLDGKAAGYLVLNDIWFPGWECTIDGKPARVHRANFLFRAVQLPAQAHEVIFDFKPVSYRWGKILTTLAAAAVLVLSLLAFATQRLSRWSKDNPEEKKEHAAAVC